MDAVQQEPSIVVEQELQLVFLYLPKMGGDSLKNGLCIRLFEFFKAADVLCLYSFAQLEKFFLNGRISENHDLPSGFEQTVIITAGLDKSPLRKPCIFILGQNILVLVEIEGEVLSASLEYW